MGSSRGEVRYRLALETGDWKSQADAAAKSFAQFNQQVEKLVQELSGSQATAQAAALGEAIEKMGGASKLSESQLDRLTQRIQQLRDAGGTIPGNLQAIADNAERAGGAFDRLGDSIMKGLGFGAGFAVAELAVVKLVESIKAVPEELLRAAEAALRYGDALERQKDRTDVSAEALQKLAYATQQAGGDFQGTTDAVAKMEKALGSNSQAFAKLGLDVDQLKRESPEKAFKEVATALEALPNQYDRAAAAAAIFGKSWTEIEPLIKHIDELGAASERASRLGLVMPENLVDQLDATGDAADTLAATWEHLWLNIGATIVSAPQTAQLLGELAEAVGAVSVAVLNAEPTVEKVLGHFTGEAADAIHNIASALVDVRDSIEHLGGAHPPAWFVWLLQHGGSGAVSEAMAGALDMVPGGGTVTQTWEGLKAAGRVAGQADYYYREAGAASDVYNGRPLSGPDVHGDPFGSRIFRPGSVDTSDIEAAGEKLAAGADQWAQQMAAEIKRKQEDAARKAAAAVARAQEQWWATIAQGAESLERAYAAEFRNNPTTRYEGILFPGQVAGSEQYAGMSPADQLNAALKARTSIVAGGGEIPPELESYFQDLMARGGGFAGEGPNAGVSAFGSKDEAAMAGIASKGIKLVMQQVVAEFDQDARHAATMAQSVHSLGDALLQAIPATGSFGTALHGLVGIAEGLFAHRADNASYLANLAHLGQQYGVGSAEYSAGKKDLDQQHRLEQAMAVIQGAGAIWAATDARTQDQRMFGGAMAGASAGAAFGPWGAAAGGLLGAITGMFHTPAWAAAADEAGEIFGFHVSDQLGKAIEAKSHDLGINVQNAALLMLPQAIQESGKDASSFFGQADQLIGAIASGAVPAAAGIESVGQAFQMMEASAKAGGAEAQAALIDVIQHSRDAHVQVGEISDYVWSQLQRAVDALPGLYGEYTGHTKYATYKEGDKDAKGRPVDSSLVGTRKKDAQGNPIVESEGHQFTGGGLPMNSEDDARDQATIFSAVFWAVVEEKGLAEATKSMKPAFDKLEAELKATGLGGGKDGAKSVLGDIEHYFSMAGNDIFAGAASSAEKLGEVLDGLANSAYLSRDAFDAIGSQLQNSYNTALSAPGATKVDAFEAIAPELIKMQRDAQEYGYKMPDWAVSLIHDMADEGHTLPKTWQDQVTGLLQDIEHNTRKDEANPHAPQNPNPNNGNTPGSGNPHGGAGGEHDPGGNRGQGAAVGFFSRRMPYGPGPGGSTHLDVHPREVAVVIPEGQADEDGLAGAGGQGAVVVNYSVGPFYGVGNEHETAETIKRIVVDDLHGVRGVLARYVPR